MTTSYSNFGEGPSSIPISPAIGRSGSTSESLGWRDAPSALQLVQAHYLVRHGERTPVRTRLLNAKPAIPARWNMCHAGKDFHSTVLDLTGSTKTLRADNWKNEDLSGTPVSMKIQKRVESTDEGAQNILATQPGECMLGELTDLGRSTTQLIGSRLRKLYIDKLGLLPKELQESDENKVYFRSTNMGRTIESLYSVVSGLLPETKANHSGNFTPTMLIRNGVTENLLPNTFGCGRLRELDRKFSQFAAAVHNPKLAALDSLLAPHLDGQVPRVDGHPRLSGILDTVRAAKVHGIPIPSAFEDINVVDAVETAVCDEWYTGYRAEDVNARDQFRRLAMGRFLNELSGRLNDKASKPSSTPLQMAVYSAHDTSIAGVLGTLDVFDNRWPAFTAAVGVELFKDTNSGGLLTTLGIKKDQHYVRMRYGDKELALPACSARGSHLDGHPEFCTLQAFSKAVESLRHPQGKSWEQECDESRHGE
jgi:acid phosphatase